jgi:adenosylcobinamide-phosphate synthase
VTALILFSAILLDRLFSEPRCLHPLVGFGAVANKIEAYLNKPHCSSTVQLIAGMFSWVLVVIIPTIFILFGAMLIEKWLGGWFYIAWLFDVLFLYLAIGYSSLRQHAMAILTPLETNDLNSARQKLGWIVSRDTASLDELGVRKATIESVLENGSDAIFAPIFWYVVGGLPAVIIYRLSNTLDAMWGYKTARFLYFGRFSARMDDVLNYLPSRLVALSYALCGHFVGAIKCWQKEAHLLNSPNAGVVMTAGAGALNCELGGDASYHGKRVNKPVFGGMLKVTNNDVNRALQLIDRTLVVWCVVIGLIVLVAHIMSNGIAIV